MTENKKYGDKKRLNVEKERERDREKEYQTLRERNGRENK